MKNSQQSLQPLLNSFRLLVVRDPVAETITFVTFIPHSNDRHRGAVQNVAVRPQPHRLQLDRSWSGTAESRWFHAIGVHSVACSATWLRGQAHWKVDGYFHLHPARCISFTRPDRCGQAHREVDGSMPSAPTSLHVLQLGLTAWSGTSERRWFHAIDIHTVACPATRPSWSGTSESRWSHASASTPLHVLQLGLTIVGRHIGKSMVPCHRHAHRCMSCNSA